MVIPERLEHSARICHKMLLAVQLEVDIVVTLTNTGWKQNKNYDISMSGWWSHHACLWNTESGLHSNPKGDFRDQDCPDVYTDTMLNIRCYNILATSMVPWMAMGLHSNPVIHASTNGITLFKV
jgi:hypothetical protein